LPSNYYALAEQIAGGLGPDVLTLANGLPAPGAQPDDSRPRQTEDDGELAAFIEVVAVGEALPDMPLFLSSERYVNVPLEATYQSAWNAVPQRWQERLTVLPASN